MNIQMMTFLVDSKPQKKVGGNSMRTQHNPLTYYQELKGVSVLSCDFTHFPAHEFARAKTPGTGDYYYKANCKCRMQLFEDSLSVHILWNEREICSTDITVV